MKKYFLLISVICISCANTYYVNKKYFKYSHSDKNFAVWPIIPILVGNSKIPDRMGPGSLYKWIEQRIIARKYIPVIKANVTEDYSLNSEDVIDYKIKIGKDSTLYNFKIPTEDNLSIYSEHPDFLLLIKSIQYIYKVKGIDYISGGTKVKVKVKYIVWSYENMEPISCGEKETFTYKPVLGRNNFFYKSIAMNITRVALFGTPFSIDR